MIDACVVLSWFFPDEVSAFGESVLSKIRSAEEDATTAAIWPLEIANSVLIGERRARWTSGVSDEILGEIASLPIAIDSEALRQAFGQIVALGREHRLSAYDASYLELAIRTGLPLATEDNQLRTAATRAGVRLF